MTKLVYTAKAERDGAGKAGDTVPSDADLAYLWLHKYCEEVDAPVDVETGAVEAPSRFMRSKKVKP